MAGLGPEEDPTPDREGDHDAPRQGTGAHVEAVAGADRSAGVLVEAGQKTASTMALFFDMAHAPVQAGVNDVATHPWNRERWLDRGERAEHVPTQA
ncbi:hypothetical protein GCM10027449_21510 [Sinomonas notoginsengisoli]